MFVMQLIASLYLEGTLEFSWIYTYQERQEFTSALAPTGCHTLEVKKFSLKINDDSEASAILQ